MAEIILVAEDDPQISELLKIILETKGYEMHWAQDGEEAVQKAKKLKPDLIVLDVMMPKLNGYEVLHVLKENLGTKDIPVIFLSAKCATDDKVVGLRMGGQDYIQKPFDIYELLARVEAALRIKANHGPFRKTDRRISDLLLADPLTGLFSYPFFQERLEEEMARARQNHYPLACLLIETDHFDTVKSKFGNLMGDQVLQKMAWIIKNSNRVVDLIGRYHNDKFIVLLTQTDAGGAFAVGERLRNLVRRSRLVSHDPNYKISIVFGISSYSPEKDISGEELLSQAEQALTNAKNSGALGTNDRIK
jgi:diguanylate cyclase (GGDEF)-like protein